LKSLKTNTFGLFLKDGAVMVQLILFW
jgi:hypothetical protein